MYLKSTLVVKYNLWMDFYNAEIRDLAPKLADDLEKEGYFSTKDVIY